MICPILQGRSFNCISLQPKQNSLRRICARFLMFDSFSKNGFNLVFLLLCSHISSLVFQLHKFMSLNVECMDANVGKKKPICQVLVGVLVFMVNGVSGVLGVFFPRFSLFFGLCIFLSKSAQINTISAFREIGGCCNLAVESRQDIGLSCLLLRLIVIRKGVF